MPHRVANQLTSSLTGRATTAAADWSSCTMEVRNRNKSSSSRDIDPTIYSVRTQATAPIMAEIIGSLDISDSAKKTLIKSSNKQVLDLRSLTSAELASLNDAWQPIAEAARARGKPIATIRLHYVSEIPHGIKEFCELKRLILTEFRGSVIALRLKPDSSRDRQEVTVWIPDAKKLVQRQSNSWAALYDPKPVVIHARAGCGIRCRDTYPPIKHAYQVQYFDDNDHPSGDPQTCDGHRYYREPKEFFKEGTNHHLLSEEMKTRRDKAAIRRHTIKESLNGVVTLSNGNQLDCIDLVALMENELKIQHDHWSITRPTEKFRFSFKLFSNKKILAGADPSIKPRSNRTGASICTDRAFGSALLGIAQRMSNTEPLCVSLDTHGHALLIVMSKHMDDAQNNQLRMSLFDPNTKSFIRMKDHGPDFSNFGRLRLSSLLQESWKYYPRDKLISMAWDDPLNNGNNPEKHLMLKEVNTDNPTGEYLYHLAALNCADAMKDALGTLTAGQDKERLVHETLSYQNPYGASALSASINLESLETQKLLTSFITDGPHQLSVDERAQLLLSPFPDGQTPLTNGIPDKSASIWHSMLKGILHPSFIQEHSFNLLLDVERRFSILHYCAIDEESAAAAGTVIHEILTSNIEKKQKIYLLSKLLKHGSDSHTAAWTAVSKGNKECFMAMLLPILDSTLLSMAEKISLIIDHLHIWDIDDSYADDLMRVVTQAVEISHLSQEDKLAARKSLIAARASLTPYRSHTEYCNMTPLLTGVSTGETEATIHLVKRILHDIPGADNIGRLLSIPSAYPGILTPLQMAIDQGHMETSDAMIKCILEAQIPDGDVFSILDSLLAARTFQSETIADLFLRRNPPQEEAMQGLISRIARTPRFNLQQKISMLRNLCAVHNQEGFAKVSPDTLLTVFLKASKHHQVNEMERGRTTPYAGIPVETDWQQLIESLRLVIYCLNPDNDQQTALHRHTTQAQGNDIESFKRDLQMLCNVGGVALVSTAMCMPDGGGNTVLWQIQRRDHQNGTSFAKELILHIEELVGPDLAAYKELLTQLVKTGSPLDPEMLALQSTLNALIHEDSWGQSALAAAAAVLQSRIGGS
jgi:hypothetical protein